MAKGIDSTILMVAWRLWKARNACVFREAPMDIHEVIRALLDDAAL